MEQSLALVRIRTTLNLVTKISLTLQQTDILASYKLGPRPFNHVGTSEAETSYCEWHCQGAQFEV